MPLPVCAILLVGVRNRRAIVAGIADAVTTSIALVRDWERPDSCRTMFGNAVVIRIVAFSASTPLCATRVAPAISHGVCNVRPAPPEGQSLGHEEEFSSLLHAPSTAYGFFKAQPHEFSDFRFPITIHNADCTGGECEFCALHYVIRRL
ncbi:MAG: hypothetical protein MZV70_12405 [Desulfobacterales bacterium]|nr:hypothetical protein [Desulfobacterales bacterium]